MLMSTSIEPPGGTWIPRSSSTLPVLQLVPLGVARVQAPIVAPPIEAETISTPDGALRSAEPILRPAPFVVSFVTTAVTDAGVGVVPGADPGDTTGGLPGEQV